MSNISNITPSFTQTPEWLEARNWGLRHGSPVVQELLPRSKKIINLAVGPPSTQGGSEEEPALQHCPRSSAATRWQYQPHGLQDPASWLCEP
eukprot:CAMPEP_0195161888 /NCGR_PEP_ID=MMETSP0448-20130528/187393_1 /TAXON_ID=66468 /ORGANISM="Heterocapsa triquestra, Strain CCMP 448" /LENGTH=91 /DNA_ID=CAMNT_0040200687 /DNA_START=548 /DNA_END=820 /DNA_ORIENTATION=+